MSLIMFKIRFRPQKKFWQRQEQEITFFFHQFQMIKVDLMNTLFINLWVFVRIACQTNPVTEWHSNK